MVDDIWQQRHWPAWRYDNAALSGLLAQVHHRVGYLLGRMENLLPIQQELTSLEVRTDDGVTTNAIEGEVVDARSVRSSLARRLGVDIGGYLPVDRRCEGLAQMMVETTELGVLHLPLNQQRMHAWHRALFPPGGAGRGGWRALRIGQWRDDSQGPMQVVSGMLGRERVHYQAPPAARISEEMERFFDWFNGEQADLDPYLKAGLAHLWLVTIHPFDDGNGRLSRAVADALLARADGCLRRYYSQSAQIARQRNDSYTVLESTQRGSLEVTVWLRWFLQVILGAVDNSEHTTAAVRQQSALWQHWADLPLNARQIAMLHHLTGDWVGTLTARKWAQLQRVSPDTALREITALMQWAVLRKLPAGGRSTGYTLAELIEVEAASP